MTTPSAPDAADAISPTGWAFKRGMIFTSDHDAPVVFPDSMRVLDATVTRRSRSSDIIGQAQRVDVITALKAMTLWWPTRTSRTTPRDRSRSASSPIWSSSRPIPPPRPRDARPVEGHRDNRGREDDLQQYG